MNTFDEAQNGDKWRTETLRVIYSLNGEKDKRNVKVLSPKPDWYSRQELTIDEGTQEGFDAKVVRLGKISEKGLEIQVENEDCSRKLTFTANLLIGSLEKK
jgi:hypothetical protein